MYRAQKSIYTVWDDKIRQKWGLAIISIDILWDVEWDDIETGTKLDNNTEIKTTALDQQPLVRI